ncbi:unnamed protein product [Cylindrotheca closterium]|uniref:Uncharacterized protein n=1 Tax=Cylindrotheca closterium TaxID=2856 RepID=A0AAD2CAV2_9STRA|nr:unnamed protein product [Cylindrotheca closterium]
MDFRSQLSAFKSGGGNSGSNNNNNNNNGGGGGRGYPSSNSSQRGYGNTNSSSSSYYGRGGGGGGGGGGRGDNSHHRDRDHHRDSHSHRDHHRDDHGKRRNRPWGNNDGGGPPQRRRYHSPDRDGLGELRQFGYIIPKGNPALPSVALQKKKTKHIALLAITIDDLPYEHIWKAWIDTLNNSASTKDEYYISLVCHAKFPHKVTTPWLKDRLLLRHPKLGRGNSYLDPEYLSRKPEWGSVEITRAMLDLLQESAKIGQDDQKDPRFSSNRYVVRMPGQTVDTTVPPTPEATAESTALLPSVDQFLFISETCLPIRTAPELFRLLPGPTVSWINGRHRKDPKTPKNKYEDDQFGLISRKIPGQFRWKADQWVLLGRLHATAILAMDRPHFHPRHQFWQHFRNINASDEMYIPTALAILGYLRYTLEGEDTQRARNNLTAGETEATATSPKNAAAKKEKEDDKAKIAPIPILPPPPEMVLKRAVTYTDWTEGMRNPACFTKGILEFGKVAQLARKEGCLVARKFAPKVVIPGEEASKDITQEKGYITAEDWLEAVQKMEQEDAEKAKLEEPVAVESKEAVEEDNSAKPEEETKEALGAEDEPTQEPKVASIKPNNTTNNDSDEEGEEEDDDDDDQQENELE